MRKAYWLSGAVGGLALISMTVPGQAASVSGASALKAALEQTIGCAERTCASTLLAASRTLALPPVRSLRVPPVLLRRISALLLWRRSWILSLWTCAWLLGTRLRHLHWAEATPLLVVTADRNARRIVI